MAGRIPSEFIQDLINRADIVEIIESRVALKKTGKNYSGLCPFHKEKTPSFSVNPDKQFFYCFGCQASGDALKFVMEFERLDFIPAVEALAAHLGVEVPREETTPEQEQARQRRTSIYDVLEKANDFYKDNLRQHPNKGRAVDYLRQRGLSGEIARDYQIGYAPPGWDNLFKALATSNQDRELLIEGGLLIENKEEDKLYDRFRDRIMFPIRDIRGRVIAFGGRVLGDGKPKYLNSPETPVFHKSLELYGLYEARKSSNRMARLLVVEGYMDVVALAQHGIRQAVATLGTATSSDHLARLFRLVPEVVFCFDGDDAGRNAAWKALQATLAQMKDGRRARFLFLPDDEDPDTLVRKIGKEPFLDKVGNATHLPEFFFSHLSDELDMTSLEGKAALSKLAMPLIQQIPEGVFKALMIDQLAAITGLSTERLLAASTPPPPAAGYQHRTYQDNAPPDYGDVPLSDDDVPPGMDDWDPGEPDLDIPAMVDAPSRTSTALIEHAIAIIMQQPEVALEFSLEEYERLKLVRGSELLWELVTSVLETEPLPSNVVLLSLFQGQEQFDRLKRLAEAEPLLGLPELRMEYGGVINTLLQRVETEEKQTLKRALLAKPLAELSAEEKEQLRQLTNSARR